LRPRGQNKTFECEPSHTPSPKKIIQCGIGEDRSDARQAPVEHNQDNIYLVKMRLEMIEGFDITVAKGRREHGSRGEMCYV
jgi:hypothetical protein